MLHKRYKLASESSKRGKLSEFPQQSQQPLNNCVRKQHDKQVRSGSPPDIARDPEEGCSRLLLAARSVGHAPHEDHHPAEFESQFPNMWNSSQVTLSDEIHQDLKMSLGVNAADIDVGAMRLDPGVQLGAAAQRAQMQEAFLASHGTVKKQMEKCQEDEISEVLLDAGSEDHAA
eukprot:4895607-Amphidinium_carterae.1